MNMLYILVCPAFIWIDPGKSAWKYGGTGCCISVAHVTGNMNAVFRAGWSEREKVEWGGQ